MAQISIVGKTFNLLVLSQHCSPDASDFCSQSSLAFVLAFSA